MQACRMRRSPRLVGYDYSQAALYFVTVCTHGREPVLGEIVAGQLQPSLAGHAAARAWEALPNRFPAVDLDAFAIMPDHVHGIVILGGDRSDSRPTVTLATVLRAFKSLSAISGNRALGRAARPFWQRSYYDRVIRNERELAAIRGYIAEDPARWETAPDRPGRPSM
ncbi:MAG TPA: transposase [Thermomicrobiales bacterium]|nr:transposase [Thermomicrobiales bacterium]